jgi:hypothetical protein
MACIKAVTISQKEYAELLIIQRKYRLVIGAITNAYMTPKDMFIRINEITEDNYVFGKGE